MNKILLSLLLLPTVSFAQDYQSTDNNYQQQSQQTVQIYTPEQYNMNSDSNNIQPQNYDSTTNNVNTISAPTMIMVSPVMGGSGVATPKSN
jgi:hypothetical protein